MRNYGLYITTSLDVHLDLAQWATSEWRWYILYLEEKAEESTKPARVREKVHIEKLQPGSLSDVQNWEERANDAIMAMESNVNILKLQQKFYRDLVEDDDFPDQERQGCTRAVAGHGAQLEELVCETQMQIARARLLIKTVSDRKTITQNAIVSSKLAATMYKQADRSAVEAIAVRIVTIVTLIYLPATFSSTFFSTDIIKYEDTEKFSMVALERFLQVTLSLMFLTFASAGLWFWIEWRRRARDFLEISHRHADVFEPELEKHTS
ncbi:hypothetical protein LX36DRAFT_729735 [Colletotrichum falcatum]|nr:hypothetical protein LX36DRAFT_729735 [Colletotrichum falcatum]